MKVNVYSRSATYQNYVKEVFNTVLETSGELPDGNFDLDAISIVHASSFRGEFDIFLRARKQPLDNLGIAVDKPDMVEMLSFAQLGIKAYFNCFMQATHYQQLVRLLENGQSWYPPHLLKQTFELAYQAAGKNIVSSKLADLTEREEQIAQLVGTGLSNREIADQCSISERTVKTHLTSIFKKLELKDRVGLVLHLQ